MRLCWMGCLVAVNVVASSYGSVAAWPSRTISWWYACDNNWPLLLKQVTPHLSLVTSIQTYCGWDVSDDGRIIGSTSQSCVDLFAAANKLGIRMELASGAGNCSIESYRVLWADTTVSPRQLLQAAQAVNASGWNIDLEPQANNCQGGAPNPGTPADAKLYATWLAAVRALLNPHGIRLTVDVAGWSPVLSEYATLAPAVDRLQDMSTYNGNGLAAWTADYENFITKAPRSAAGVGLGAWTDGKDDWWETAEGANAKVARAKADGIPELAVFRLVPTGNASTEWPLQFWWPALEAFMT